MKIDSIARVENLTREEFLADYYRKQPVIMTEPVKAWKAFGLWSPEYFASEFGDIEVWVQTSEKVTGGEGQVEFVHEKKKIADYVKGLLDNDPDVGYWSIYPLFEQFPELESHCDFPDIDTTSSTTWSDFFFGGPTSGTVTHYDCMENIFSQLYGSKRFRLISPDYTPDMYAVNQHWLDVHTLIDIDDPDYDRFPRFKNVEVLDIVIEPGQLMYLPSGWWHCVQSLDVTISINHWFGNEDFVAKNAANLADPKAKEAYHFEFTPDMIVTNLVHK